MSVQVENLEKNMAKLTIEVAAEEVEKAIQAAYLKEKGKISMPGFRKGKVPRKMIEKMYGEAVFYEDAANTLIQENYPAAVEESGIDIVSRPTIDVVQIESGKPFIFTAEVALKPEVKLGTYKGIKVEKADLTVTDEEVDAKINEERESNVRPSIFGLYLIQRASGFFLKQFKTAICHKLLDVFDTRQIIFRCVKSLPFLNIMTVVTHCNSLHNQIFLNFEMGGKPF